MLHRRFSRHFLCCKTWLIKILNLNLLSTALVRRYHFSTTLTYRNILKQNLNKISTYSVVSLSQNSRIFHAPRSNLQICRHFVFYLTYFYWKSRAMTGDVWPKFLNYDCEYNLIYREGISKRKSRISSMNWKTLYRKRKEPTPRRMPRMKTGWKEPTLDCPRWVNSHLGTCLGCYGLAVPMVNSVLHKNRKQRQVSIGVFPIRSCWWLFIILLNT